MKTRSEYRAGTQFSVKEKSGTKKADNETVGSGNKMQDIGKNYERIPHPTLRNTFILKERKN